MSEFKIKLARIEAFEDGAQGKQVCAVFHIERGPTGFHVPIYLQGRPTRAKFGSFRPLNSNTSRR